MTKAIDLVTTTAQLALAMNADGLAAFNAGCYAGTTIKVRQLTGNETVRIVGMTAGARLEAESWIVDRFGPIGARQIKSLLNQK